MKAPELHEYTHNKIVLLTIRLHSNVIIRHRSTAAEVLQRLQTQEFDDSCHEEQDFDIPDEPHFVEESERSDSSGNDEETEQNQQDSISASVDSSQN